MRVLIVDDEPVARSRLRRFLASIEGVETVGEAENGSDALRAIEELAPDVVLLDIDMPGLDGMSVARDPRVPPVIFTTAHRQFTLEAFEANAYDYLLKPIARERLERALDRVRQRSAPKLEPDEPWRLIVVDGSLRRVIDARLVSCFVSSDKYVVFRWRDRELLLRESLDTLERRLSPLGFLRPNRGALVRRDAVEAFDVAEGGSLVLTDGQRVPVSRRATPAIRAALGLGS